MKLKYRILAKFQFFAFAFYPKTTVLVCVLATVLIDALLGTIMVLTSSKVVYDIVFALMTGATASFMVSIAVELSNNYKNNKLAWHELQDYYSVVNNYESMKQVHMAQTPHQRAEAKAREEYISAGGKDDLDEDDVPKDIVQATWEQLPKIMPMLKKTLEEKKLFLTEDELSDLGDLIFNYAMIRSQIFFRIMPHLLHNSLNHPDEKYLNRLYPQNIITDMPDWMRDHMASVESQKAIERLVDCIMSDEFLLHHYMEGYDISQHAIDSYDDSDDECISVEIGDDEYDFSDGEEVDEETFKAQNDMFYQYMEESGKPFVSRQISQCCLNIAQCLDELEKHIVNKPYVGWQLRMDKKFSKKNLCDPISKIAYERKKEELNKKGNYNE